jgi:hypothetical protein
MQFFHHVVSIIHCIYHRPPWLVGESPVSFASLFVASSSGGLVLFDGWGILHRSNAPTLSRLSGPEATLVSQGQQSHERRRHHVPPDGRILGLWIALNDADLLHQITVAQSVLEVVVVGESLPVLGNYHDINARMQIGLERQGRGHQERLDASWYRNRREEAPQVGVGEPLIYALKKGTILTHGCVIHASRYLSRSLSKVPAKSAKEEVSFLRLGNHFMVPNRRGRLDYHEDLRVCHHLLHELLHERGSRKTSAG